MCYNVEKEGFVALFLTWRLVMFQRLLVIFYCIALAIAAGNDYRETGNYSSELGAVACILFVCTVFYEMLDKYFEERGM